MLTRHFAWRSINHSHTVVVNTPCPRHPELVPMHTGSCFERHTDSSGHSLPPPDRGSFCRERSRCGHDGRWLCYCNTAGGLKAHKQDARNPAASHEDFGRIACLFPHSSGIANLGISRTLCPGISRLVKPPSKPQQKPNMHAFARHTRCTQRVEAPTLSDPSVQLLSPSLPLVDVVSSVSRRGDYVIRKARTRSNPCPGIECVDLYLPNADQSAYTLPSQVYTPSASQLQAGGCQDPSNDRSGDAQR